jgi:hypothetical protein
MTVQNLAKRWPRFGGRIPAPIWGPLLGKLVRRAQFQGRISAPIWVPRSRTCFGILSPVYSTINQAFLVHTRAFELRCLTRTSSCMIPPKVFRQGCAHDRRRSRPWSDVCSSHDSAAQLLFNTIRRCLASLEECAVSRRMLVNNRFVSKKTALEHRQPQRA